MRLPKDFDPANPGPMPNPERWLPKWQRSDFKKKRTRRKEKVRLFDMPNPGLAYVCSVNQMTDSEWCYLKLPCGIAGSLGIMVESDLLLKS